MLAGALRFYGLVRQSAWADEITTLFITDPSASLAAFWQRVLSDTHPPLYYLLLRAWSAAFGQSDLAARLPSAIFGVVAVAAAMITFKGCRFRTRLTLSLFLALSPGAIEYSQEARSYSLLLLLSTIITGACFQFVRASCEESGNALPALIALAVAGIVASYTHYFGFLIAVAACLTAILASLGNRRRCISAALALAGTVSLFLPWVFYHLHYMSYGMRMSGWIADFPVGATVSWFIRLSLGGTAGVLGAAAIAGTFSPMPSFRAYARRAAAWRVAPVLPLLVVGAALAISWHIPVLTARNLIVLLPALYLAMASFDEFGAIRWGMPAMLALVGMELLLMTQSLPGYYTARTKEQWRESAAFLLAQPGCRMGPIYVYGDATNYRWLIEKERPHLRLIEVPLDGGAVPPLTSATDCGVLIWAADLSRSQFNTVLATLPADRSCVRVEAFYWAFVALGEPAVSGHRGCELVQSLPQK